MTTTEYADLPTGVATFAAAQRWEYKYLTAAIGAGGKADMGPLMKSLNELGAEGWEMCGYATADKLLGFNAHVMILKRSTLRAEIR